MRDNQSGQRPPYDYIVQVPDGVYIVKYMGHETLISFGKKVVVLWFTILPLHDEANKNQYEGMWLYGWFPIHEFGGRLGKNKGVNKSFYLTSRQNLARQVCSVTGQAIDSRKVVPISLLEPLVIHVRVEQTQRDYEQREIPPAMRISKVTKLIKAHEL